MRPNHSFKFTSNQITYIELRIRKICMSNQRASNNGLHRSRVETILLECSIARAHIAPAAVPKSRFNNYFRQTVNCNALSSTWYF